MLKRIERADVPPLGFNVQSPIRQFAAETLGEFFEAAQPGDVFEVSGWPSDSARDAVRQADRVRQAVKDELWAMGRGTRGGKPVVEVFRRKERLFIRMPEPVTPAQVEAMTGKPIRGMRGI